jgi:cytochrome c oxidase subunit 1
LTITEDRIGSYHPGEARTERPPRRRWWLRQNILTALVGAIIGYLVGHWMGDAIAGGYTDVQNTGTNNAAIILALTFGVVGWLAGIGAFNYPLAKIVGVEAPPETPTSGWKRFFELTLDHKVVGRQYIVAVLVFFFTAGLFAMGIRTELLTPYTHYWSPDVYLQIVSEHGTMMMMMATSLVVGPLGNFLVPLMLGARRMAFPRLEASSLWLFVAGYLVILIALPLGGFNTGWTGYAPLQTQAKAGMDCYLVGFAVIGTGMITNGFNQIVTIVNYRAPGLRWSRLSMFTWSMLATSFLLTLATPVFFCAVYFGALDRSALTAFYVNTHGGSSYLWENLFWFFGHPEVYIMALPAFGLVSEMIPVFCRKPLFGYKISAAGMFGVALLSFFVWQHHLFQSGISPNMRPLFMMTTELISIPTGIIYLVGMGTLWKARIRFEVPMLFCLALYFNFLIGGMTGVFLSDVPVNVTVHGSFFVLAHFHYTIMGGLVFAFFGAVYYYTPRMTGHMLNKTLGKIHFWFMFVFFNLTFFPLFIVGFLGMPRRVFEYAPRLQTLNDIASISSFVLGASFLIFVVNFVWSVWINPLPCPANPWDSRGLEWKLPTPLPWNNFERIPVILNDPYHYGDGDLPVADLSGTALLQVLAEEDRVPRSAPPASSPPLPAAPA